MLSYVIRKCCQLFSFSAISTWNSHISPCLPFFQFFCNFSFEMLSKFNNPKNFHISFLISYYFFCSSVCCCLFYFLSSFNIICYVYPCLWPLNDPLFHASRIFCRSTQLFACFRIHSLVYPRFKHLLVSFFLFLFFLFFRLLTTDFYLNPVYSAHKSYSFNWMDSHGFWGT